MSDLGAPAFADWLAIRDLTATYNRCFDEADPRGWASTFTDTGRLQVAGKALGLIGRNELERFCNARGWGFLHFTLDPQISVHGNTAVQRCNLMMFRRHPNDAPPDLLTTGRYVDHLVRIGAGWRFQERHVELDAPIPAPVGVGNG